nr:histidine kinase [Butyrivibrio sp.]
IIVIIAFFVSGRVSSQAERTLTISMEKASELVEYSLLDCISESRDASYLSTIKSAHADYKKTGDMGKLRSLITPFLEEHYKFNPAFNRTVLTFTDTEGQLFYTQNESAKKRLVSMSEFREKDLPEIMKVSENIGTGIGFTRSGGRVYMVRNIVERNFVPMAVLIMELDPENVFGSLLSVPEYERGEVRLGDMLLAADDEAQNHGEKWSAFSTDGSYEDPFGEGLGALEGGAFVSAASGTFMSEGKGGYFITRREKIEGNTFDFSVKYDRNALLLELRSMELMFLLLLIFMIPLVFVVFRFFDKKVSTPISKLKEASQKITDGMYGSTVEEKGQNREIAELTENFNNMSRKLDEQFNKIFLEEIALRDANIHALQSQINPHFLNNTLEIINWEAKLSGNDKVGRMIEALSTMMSATMNRDKRTAITLEEELSYVRAFIYIVSCRYEERFTYEENVDESLLNIMVPRMIIQPVVENAVEYGAGPDGNRYVELSINEDGGNIIIRVVNHGVPSKENMEKIKRLLSEDVLDQTQDKGIGIRNVDQRLKMMYGEAYGLSISPDGNGDTISTILVKK